MKKEGVMDTSEKYIKMCEKAEEIQREWKPNKVDAVIIKLLRDESGLFRLPSGIQYLERKQPDPYTGWHMVGSDPNIHYMFKRFIWLPRQDQLQEILQYRNQSYLLDRCNEFVEDLWEQGNRLAEPETSMEVYWLAFVMDEKYGKVWFQREIGPGGQLMDFSRGEWVVGDMAVR